MRTSGSSCRRIGKRRRSPRRYVVAGAGHYHVCVVNDGSPDATGSLALAAGAHVLEHMVNLGQGAALQTGISYALANGAEYVCTFDADGQHAGEVDFRALVLL